MRKQNDLDKLLARRSRLTRDEYLDLLYEIRKNYIIYLVRMSREQKTKGTAGALGIIDKTHWLIDSVENTGAKDEETKPTVINVMFAKAPEGEERDEKATEEEDTE